MEPELVNPHVAMIQMKHDAGKPALGEDAVEAGLD